MTKARRIEKRSGDPTGELTNRNARRVPRRSAWPTVPGRRAIGHNAIKTVGKTEIVQTPSGRLRLSKIVQTAVDDFAERKVELTHLNNVGSGESLPESARQICGELLDQLVARVGLAVSSLFFFNHATNFPVGGGDDCVHRPASGPPALFEQRDNPLKQGFICGTFQYSRSRRHLFLAPSVRFNPTAFQAVSFEQLGSTPTTMRGWRNTGIARTRSST
jgi:hypothetical protein